MDVYPQSHSGSWSAWHSLHTPSVHRHPHIQYFSSYSPPLESPLHPSHASCPPSSSSLQLPQAHIWPTWHHHHGLCPPSRWYLVTGSIEDNKQEARPCYTQFGSCTIDPSRLNVEADTPGWMLIPCSFSPFLFLFFFIWSLAQAPKSWPKIPSSTVWQTA